MANVKKITISLPEHLVKDLNLISGNLCISRSALISEILSESVPPMKNIVDISLGGLSENSNAPLARNPEKVKSYIDSLRSAIEDESKKFDNSYSDLMSSLGGSTNEH